MRLEGELADPVESRANGFHLLQDVDAVGAVVDHASDPADVALHAPKALHDLAIRGRVGLLMMTRPALGRFVSRRQPGSALLLS